MNRTITSNNLLIKSYLDSNYFKKNYSKDTLPYLLFSQQRNYSDKIYLRDSQKELTFNEVCIESLKISLYLRLLSLCKEPVGLYMEPSAEMCLGIWGILMACKSYIPLSLDYPEERLQYMIDNSGINYILTSRECQKKLHVFNLRNTKIICLEDAESFLSEYKLTNTELDFWSSEEDLAYIIYTSGSTGSPKGVMIQHKNISHQMNWLESQNNIGLSTKILHKTPISFDAAQWEILSGCNGSEVVIGPVGIHKDPEKITSMIKQYGINTLQGVPTLLQALTENDFFGDCKTLKYIFSGGEALTKKLAASIFKQLPNAKITNLYGPTECTINISSHTLVKDSIENYKDAIPIGNIVNNHSFILLNKKGDHCSNGETGELYISGIQVSNGYYKNTRQTLERFVTIDDQYYYKTGDLVVQDEDLNLYFAGRLDNQVKLRGYRLELDEIKINIEKHPWVRHAAVIMSENTSNSAQQLIAFIELNPNEAALMDQGVENAHHHASKSDQLQIKAQLSNAGCKNDKELTGKESVKLPGYYSDSFQTEKVFARKSYRSFEGGNVNKEQVLNCLNKILTSKTDRFVPSSYKDLSFQDFSYIMRYFGAFYSEERVLPKYSYASPGALYATQIFLEIANMKGLKNGFYYYHPVMHALFLIDEYKECSDNEKSPITLHFIGKKSTIESVYKNNIKEVLEFETGHIIGVFDNVLMQFQQCIGKGYYSEEIDHSKEKLFGCRKEDYYLGSFPIIKADSKKEKDNIAIEILIQFNKETLENKGIYQYINGELIALSDEKIEKNDVIAINQRIYENAEIGVCFLNHVETWDQYIELGRLLQIFQMNDQMMGFVSSGYSSKSGNDLKAAKKIKKILKLNDKTGIYFALGGKISLEQKYSRGMKEDTVHMAGPAEIIKQDLASFLPDYMLPGRVVILQSLPRTSNGKIDLIKIQNNAQEIINHRVTPFVLPNNETQFHLLDLWKNLLKIDKISVKDDFFELGGNSLSALLLINRINKELKCNLPVQILFEARNIISLSEAVIQNTHITSSSRMISLNKATGTQPVICWPGLGGYPLNLEALGKEISSTPVYGFQAYGLNSNEIPYTSLEEMALEDIKVLKERYPEGPYTLAGYSFGAKLAYEIAFQLEKMNDTINKLILIAPGSPNHRTIHERKQESISFDDPYFITILYSVFTRSIEDTAIKNCLEKCKDRESFIHFINQKNADLGIDSIRRITHIVERTFHFVYNDLSNKKLNTEVIHIKAAGDQDSFIENNINSINKIDFFESTFDHYAILKEEGVTEIMKMIRLN
ncbi:amino acid adenylation domain-containing protein [Chryseobacterium sp. ES2]|uniref:Amino acid adenylation domain-containing protein n=1 Tax=Chryseobacterium metallicongregator TaxID=3073042 RepID=A0ABU1DZN0_9FLAO|nr:amino acid adenylation domain-containing protein [Chryseobacterium sp. ES2]MDR4950997.1 amino acid adenylation domain-containing protein [Chryseobacterium sp. ES2]